MEIIGGLPEECVSHIVSLTSPRDAGRSSLVSRAFMSATDADVVWEKFLPNDYREIISSAASSSTLLSLSKKNLYLHLCHNPILIGDCKMSFALEKESGKKCYMLGARALSIAWGDTPEYWEWISLPQSRFPQVAELNYVWWFDVKGKIDTKLLDRETTYAAYLLFKFSNNVDGFRQRPVELRVNIEASGDGGSRMVYLDPSDDTPNFCRERGDGWMETEMGEFFNETGDDGILECSLREVDNFITKDGIIIEGIELRPKVAAST